MLSQDACHAHDSWETTLPPTFAAILLVCLASQPPEGCNEETAVEVRSIVVENELGCTMGWQELIARANGATGDDVPVYLKTICRRMKPPGSEAD